MEAEGTEQAPIQDCGHSQGPGWTFGVDSSQSQPSRLSLPKLEHEQYREWVQYSMRGAISAEGAAQLGLWGPQWGGQDFF